MRIWHLLKHSVRGNGHVHVAVDLACAQAEAGHEVVFASGDGSFDGLLRAHGVRVLDLPSFEGVTGRAGRARTAAATELALVRAAVRARPDVVHAHMMSSAVLGYGVAKLARAPMVTTMHNSFEAHSNLMKLGTVVVAVSEAERQMLLGRGYRPGKVVTVLNGVTGSAREAEEPQDLGPLPRPCVMTLSGLHPRKAVDDVIRAFAQVAGDFPDWHLDVVGWGPGRDPLVALADELGVDQRVHFLGAVDNPRSLLQEADVFATASLADPCPLTVAEARAAGCAIVGTSVGGIPELLDSGRAGRLVPPREPQAMAAVLREYMGDPDLLASWQARARHGSEHFTVARMSEDYEKVYRSLIRARPRASRRVPATVTPAAGAEDAAADRDTAA